MIFLYFKNTYTVKGESFIFGPFVIILKSILMDLEERYRSG